MSDPFDEHRRLLFSVAYDLLGSVADAEDVVQETWLRWSKDDRSDVQNPRAYLVRIATTQALNRIRAVQARKESYIGPWLPEPLVEPDPAEAIADRAAREQAVSLAMLVVLETLSPAERAVFVLREVFGMAHDEIATALDRSPASVRQLAHRAREHVQARRPRFPTDDAVQRQVTEQFLRTCATDDRAGLLAILAPDVTLVSDGGGVVSAARRPIVGADKVSRFLAGIAPEVARNDLVLARVNGDVGILATRDDAAVSVLHLDIEDGLIRTIYVVSNPEKLTHVNSAY